jgi:FkbM family methyltransferase
LTRKFATPAGTYFLPDDAKDDIVSAAIRMGEVFEERIMQMARHFVKPGTTVFDVGANYGQFSIMLAAMAGVDGSVHAFEANPHICAILEANLAVNGIHSVIVHQKAVYESSGETLLFPVPDLTKYISYGSFGVDPRAEKGIEVETIALDDVSVEKPVSFLKVDVQGADLMVLRGARSLIRRHRMPIVLEYEECFQEQFETSLRDYTDIFDLIDYRIEDVYNPYPGSINFLITPR